VSTTTLDRVKTILEEGTPEQVEALRNKNETGEGPGVRTVYEQVQQEKQKGKLQQQQTDSSAQEVRRDKPKLLNKDFRLVTKQEIEDGTIDLVLVFRLIRLLPQFDVVSELGYQL
jgi:hypothetical protein